MKRTALLIVCLLMLLPGAFAQTNEKREGFGQQFDISSLDLKQFSLADIIGKPEVLLALINPVEYEVTPGDRYELVIGADLERRISYPLTVEADGTVELPYIGKIDTTDMKYSAFRLLVIKGIKAKAPLPYVEVVLRMPAVLDVFVYGGVDVPGFVKVTSANRLLEAVLFAKGPKKGASFRRIQLIRGGTTIVCDLATYINEGDLSNNPYLKPGDKIYVPHPDVVVNISGGVKYPGFFELVPGETAADLIRYAGGLLPTANAAAATRLKSGPDGEYKLENLDVTKADAVAMGNGDALVVPMQAVYENGGMITVEGAVYGKPLKPGEPVLLTSQPKPLVLLFPYYPGLSLLSLLEQVGGPNPFALADQTFIERKDTPDKIRVDAEKLWKTKDGTLDVVLQPGDHVVVPMIELLVFVGGEVQDPGAKPFVSGKTAADYLLYAGGFKSTANPNVIWMVFRDGTRQTVPPTQPVTPGTILFIDRNGLEYFKEVMTTLGIAAGVITSGIVIANYIYSWLQGSALQ
ncbi:MAG: SLBB domain-containing protein [Spirochaetales bacterium]|nr:SLBB domain-containing protein [Spirochaetales bacterium]